MSYATLKAHVAQCAGATARAERATDKRRPAPSQWAFRERHQGNAEDEPDLLSVHPLRRETDFEPG